MEPMEQDCKVNEPKCNNRGSVHARPARALGSHRHRRTARANVIAALAPLRPLHSHHLDRRARAQSPSTSPLDGQAIGSGTVKDYASLARHYSNGCTDIAAMLVPRARTDATTPLMPVPSPPCLCHSDITVATVLAPPPHHCGSRACARSPPTPSLDGQAIGSSSVDDWALDAALPKLRSVHAQPA